MEKYKCHLQVQKYLKSNFIQKKIYMYTFKSGVVRNKARQAKSILVRNLYGTRKIHMRQSGLSGVRPFTIPINCTLP